MCLPYTIFIDYTFFWLIDKTGIATNRHFGFKTRFCNISIDVDIHTDVCVLDQECLVRTIIAV